MARKRLITLGPGAIIKKLFTVVIYEFLKWAWVFVSGRLFCGQGQEPTIERSTRKVFILGRLWLYLQALKAFLWQTLKPITKILSYGQKKFNNTGPWLRFDWRVDWRHRRIKFNVVIVVVTVVVVVDVVVDVLEIGLGVVSTLDEVELAGQSLAQGLRHLVVNWLDHLQKNYKTT